MGSLLKQTITRYLDADGRQVPKGTPGARKVQERSSKWYGQYTDADGVRRRVALCADKGAARQRLAELEKRAALAGAGVVDPFEEHRKTPIGSHIDAYLRHVENKTVTSDYLAEVTRELRTIAKHLEAKTLQDLTPEALEDFLGMLARRGTGPVTRNKYLTSAKAFSKWCVRTRRAGIDPLAGIQPASGAKRRKRRALTEAEFAALLKAARERPLANATAYRQGPKKGQPGMQIDPAVRTNLVRAGEERSLVYRTLVLTGLRRGELADLKVGHLMLDGDRPHLRLPGESTKNDQEAYLPLKAELAADLKAWIAHTGKAADDALFRVPESLVIFLKRDLAYAGIPYKDAQGRTIDVHALRHTTCTFMARAKVSPRVAQRFMRHSDIRLTMQTYTDPTLLDETEALDALPSGEPPAEAKGKRGKKSTG